MYVPSAAFVDVENPTRFTCFTKIAAQFRSGRVFLAGDSAHLCSPSEGHGMNTGIQDAFNLAWKLALVYHGVADESLLDSYEAERRPIAEAITKSGDVFEQAQMMTDPVEREMRDQAIRALLSDPQELHHQVMAETELIIDYSGSPIITGDTNDQLSAGFRLPDTIAVEWPETPGRGLHQLAHRAGHTLLLLAGTEANDTELASLHAAIQSFAVASPMFESAVTLATCSGASGRTSHLKPDAADRLGIKGMTLLAMRPDGYVGLRSDSDHLAAVERYQRLIQAGKNPLSAQSA
jgi:hypothetical protein